MTAVPVRNGSKVDVTDASEHVTWCHICEAVCGVVAYVKDDRVVKITADRENPFSRGYICPKGVNDHLVTNDPDRVVRPLRRQADGSFTEVGWDEALEDISRRLKGIIRTHGSGSVAGYLGNPSVWDYTMFFSVFNLIKGLKSPHLYTTGSLDINNRWAVNQLLYGNPLRSAVPDIPRTQFHFIVGSNPLISHGSMVTQPRIREALLDITKRGGRVVVVDPRRTETAEHFEWLPIRADTDAWMLLSILHVIFAEGLEDSEALERQTVGIESLRRFVEDYPPESTEAVTTIPAEQLRRLARDLAAAESAAIHGRCGTSLGSFSTAVTYLLDVLVMVTGNLDRPGGSVFPRPAIDLELIVKLFGLDTYGSYQSRLGGFNDVMGTLPVGELAAEITTPGQGRIRALFMGCANIVTTSAGGDELEEALDDLELFVSFDLYRNETNTHADYILPDVTGLEREDFPFYLMQHMTVPYIQWTEAAVKPRGEARPTWWVIDQICRRTGIAPNPLAAGRLGWRLGIRPSLPTVLDAFLRLGPYGDGFGLRRRGLRLSRRKLLANPRGFLLEDHVPTGSLARRLPARDRKVHVDVPLLLNDLARLRGVSMETDERFPLRLISLRELRSHNSRMHNVDPLMRNRRQLLRMHPDDAARAGVGDGDLVAVVSGRDRIEVPVKVTDEMTPGTIALPQGWGHKGGGWKRAIAAGGVNYNRLSPRGRPTMDPVSGQACLNGFPVRVEFVAKAPDLPEATVATVAAADA